MCFNQPTSFAFAFVGLAATIFCWKKTKNFRVTTGVFFFFLMELLQGFQYFLIDQCDSWVNKILTLLGGAHICLQPFFTHFMVSGLVVTPKGKAVYNFIFKISLFGCAFLALRWPLSYIPYFTPNPVHVAGFIHGPHPEGEPLLGTDSSCGRSPEWLRGNEICTFSGRTHLGWSIPLSDFSYHLPSSFIHAFTMFAPFFALKQRSWVYGLCLMTTGPIFARLFTDDLMERASIWCFYSSLQIIVMVFAIHWFFNDPKRVKALKDKIEKERLEKLKKKEAAKVE